ncbi:hypothetical protein BJ508DRAFT_358045 [Ascobolus immersus RN42]|uniref:Uncharacterized protein n=1 Tax=Ascobolus immersus RN42 TaxID=1160509 RepID=A0A3N4IQD1_ASCIM|nr:hypothetical protein BJ508DRAFT_358045 [Ascobolus immersus RN42]
MGSSSSKKDAPNDNYSEEERLAYQMLETVQYFATRTKPARTGDVDASFISDPELRLIYEDLVHVTSPYWDTETSKDLLDELPDEDIRHIISLRNDIELLRSKLAIPPPLRPLAEKMLLFFGDTLFPYTVPLRKEYDGTDALGLIEAVLFGYAFGQSYTPPMLGLLERWDKGMVRPAYVQILEAVLDAYMDELRGMVRRREPYERIEWVGLNVANQLRFFFISERFRSDRMEKALLGYLQDDGVDMEVARGVWKATERFREECKAFQMQVEDSPTAEEEEREYFKKIARHADLPGSGIDISTYSFYWEPIVRRARAASGEV